MIRSSFSFATPFLLLALFGCGGSTPNTSGPTSFSLQAAPAAISIVPGGNARPLIVSAIPMNGFSGSVTVQVGALPPGITAAPMSVAITPGTLQQITITAAPNAAMGSTNIPLTGTSGNITQTASAALTVAAPAAPPGFSLQAAPSTVTVTPGGNARSLTVGATPVNGFTGNITVQVGALPAGVTATPATVSLTPGTLQQILIAASSTAAAGSGTISLTGTSGDITQSASAALTVAAAPPATTTASLSATSFDFGHNLVNNALTKTVTIVTNTGSNLLTLSPVLSGDPSYSIATGGSSCGLQLAAGASCNMMLNYNPTTSSSPAAQTTTLNMGFGDVPDGTPQTIAITGISASMAAGQVTATNNPQVALYTMTLPFPGSVTVNFGTTTSYGLQTWTQSTTTPGGTVSIFVAGMLASTAYHMQASVQFVNGITTNDADHTFTTQAVPANMQIQLTTATTPGMTPQPGLELINPIGAATNGVIVTDLSGNTLWAYADPGNTSLNFIDGVKMLPNGHLLMVIGPSSQAPLPAPIPAAAITEIREVTLGGDTVNTVNLNDLNSELAAASCAECNVSLVDFHHDVEPLPNGHMLIVANTIMALSSTSTPALTNLPAQNVLGDVIIDLDQNMHPVWAWNEFNHLDPNRHPYMFPDWTHTNAVVYSPDDGNIIVSIRHQNWVLKINYANGAGTGNILWHLGEGGDFTLVGGTDPTDWPYAQHAPSFFSPNTSGVFSLGMMDNGDDRIFPAGVTCDTSGAPPCLYSTVPVWQLDETAKTATFTFHDILPASQYNNFGGNAEQLANGNVEFDLCGVGANSLVYEVTQTSTPQTVWSMSVTGSNLYRAFRIPSFYPGVQW
jgi:arylsulfate sulfotransferase